MASTMFVVDNSESASASGSDSDSDGQDSEDFQLREAFAKGEINTGCLTRLVPFVRRNVVNNSDGLKRAISSLSVSSPSRLTWFERMDVNNDPAPVAPELAAHLDEQNDEHAVNGHDDDFKREVFFYRQAQAAVLECLPRVRRLGFPTRRPDDYFAQMLKSDEHMQKVRQVLVNNQLVIERREKARKLRELKKYGKQVQTDVLLRRAKEKRETLDSVKKFRRGQRDKLDFLDSADAVDQRIKPKPKAGTTSKKMANDTGSNGRDHNKQERKNKQPVSVRKKAKDAKYGFGGKKKRGKYNDAESSADVSGYRRSMSGVRSNKRTSSSSASKKKQQKGGKNNRRTRK